RSRTRECPASLSWKPRLPCSAHLAAWEDSGSDGLALWLRVEYRPISRSKLRRSFSAWPFSSLPRSPTMLSPETSGNRDIGTSEHRQIGTSWSPFTVETFKIAKMAESAECQN